MNRTNRGSLRFFLPFLLLLLTSTGALAQLAGGRSITGTVRVGEGRTPDQRVRVRLFATGGGLREEIYTDSSGKFNFGGLAPGDYVVECAAPGYVPARESVLILGMAGYRAVVSMVLTPESPGGPKPPAGLLDATVPPKAREHWQKAQEALAAGKTDRARKELEQAVKAEPAFGPGYRLLGMLALDEARLDDADAALKRATELLPGDPDTMALKGGLLNRRDRSSDAVPLLEKALAGNAASWRAHFELAQADFALKRYSDALPHARQALSLRGAAFPEGEVLLANVLMNLKQYPEAAQHLAEFLKLAPNSPSAPPAREVLNKMKQAGVPVPEYR